MALPEFVEKGTFTADTGALSVPAPGGIAANDLLILLVESANQAITTPEGYTQVATNSPKYTGTAGTTGSVRLGVFWKVTTGSESDLTVADTGNHTAAVLLAFRGVDVSAPIHQSAGSTSSGVTTPTLPAVTTAIDDCLILYCVAGHGPDGTSTTNLSSWTAGITERADAATSAGVGGVLGAGERPQITAGTTTASTVTQTSSYNSACITIALAPVGPALLSAAVGAFAITGPAQALLHPRRLAAAAGAFAITGPDQALLLFSGHRLPAGAGALQVTSPDQGLLWGHRLIAERWSGG